MYVLMMFSYSDSNVLLSTVLCYHVLIFECSAIYCLMLSCSYIRMFCYLPVLSYVIMFLYSNVLLSTVLCYHVLIFKCSAIFCLMLSCSYIRVFCYLLSDVIMFLYSDVFLSIYICSHVLKCGCSSIYLCSIVLCSDVLLIRMFCHLLAYCRMF